MKNLLTLFMIIVFVIAGCGQDKTKNTPGVKPSAEATGSHHAQNSLDWQGTYSGVVPCASCEGIKTTIVLNEDNSYRITMVYLGENQPNRFEHDGLFRWNKAGNTITLEGEEVPNQYFVGENYLAKLDMDGNRVTGKLAKNYVLSKE